MDTYRVLLDLNAQMHCDNVALLRMNDDRKQGQSSERMTQHRRDVRGLYVVRQELGMSTDDTSIRTGNALQLWDGIRVDVQTRAPRTQYDDVHAFAGTVAVLCWPTMSLNEINVVGYCSQAQFKRYAHRIRTGNRWMYGLDCRMLRPFAELVNRYRKPLPPEPAVPAPPKRMKPDIDDAPIIDDDVEWCICGRQLERDRACGPCLTRYCRRCNHPCSIARSVCIPCALKIENEEIVAKVQAGIYVPYMPPVMTASPIANVVRRPVTKRKQRKDQSSLEITLTSDVS